MELSRQYFCLPNELIESTNKLYCLDSYVPAFSGLVPTVKAALTAAPAEIPAMTPLSDKND
jgi:hypothetical protein